MHPRCVPSCSPRAPKVICSHPHILSSRHLPLLRWNHSSSKESFQETYLFQFNISLMELRSPRRTSGKLILLLDSSWEIFLIQSNGQEILAADSVLLKQIKMIFSKTNSPSLTSPFPHPPSFSSTHPHGMCILSYHPPYFFCFLIQCTLCYQSNISP